MELELFSSWTQNFDFKSTVQICLHVIIKMGFCCHNRMCTFVDEWLLCTLFFALCFVVKFLVCITPVYTVHDDCVIISLCIVAYMYIYKIFVL